MSVLAMNYNPILLSRDVLHMEDTGFRVLAASPLCIDYPAIRGENVGPLPIFVGGQVVSLLGTHTYIAGQGCPSSLSNSPLDWFSWQGGTTD